MENLKGVEVILTDLDKNPSCLHGPTILFKRTSGGVEEKFYACAACRDRKDCSFFHKFEDKWTSKRQEQWDRRKQILVAKFDQVEMIERFKRISLLEEDKRWYCHTCSSFVNFEEGSCHQSHDVTKGVTDYQLSHPSELLKPLESAKKEAQYLFAKRSTEVIVQMLRSAGIYNVLCVGAPRVHEHIRSEHSSDMKSMLLDIDHRYHQFYDESEFAWFNAFNCHWLLGKKGKAATLRFMHQPKSRELVLVTDPPFGGRVEPLAHTFQRLCTLHGEYHQDRESPIKVMWIFPYFMEPMILDSCSNMTMLDYKVDYDNHPLFQQGHKGRKYGSPVRIFTNISPSKLPLPKEEGYKFCEVCQRWVSSENKHCYMCNGCNSKDGRTYVHCVKCARCVKPSWRHCQNCKRCCLPDHKCGEFQPFGCFACHQVGHKKNDCPLRNDSEQQDGANRPRLKAKRQHNNSTEMDNSISGPSSKTKSIGKNSHKKKKM